MGGKAAACAEERFRAPRPPVVLQTIRFCKRMKDGPTNGSIASKRTAPSMVVGCAAGTSSASIRTDAASRLICRIDRCAASHLRGSDQRYERGFRDAVCSTTASVPITRTTAFTTATTHEQAQRGRSGSRGPPTAKQHRIGSVGFSEEGPSSSSP